MQREPDDRACLVDDALLAERLRLRGRDLDLLAGYPERPPDWARREFLPARKRAGLRDSLRLHDLRHYAVSRLIEQGANVLLVSKVAGHARPSVTLDVYAPIQGRARRGGGALRPARSR